MKEVSIVHVPCDSAEKVFVSGSASNSFSLLSLTLRLQFNPKISKCVHFVPNTTWLYNNLRFFFTVEL